MANIKLIDAQGDERTYNGVAKVKIPLADGTGNATFIQPTSALEITENGTHDVTKYASAEVNVPIPEGYIQPSGTKEITENGTHSVREYENVNVAVPSEEPILQEKTATENGVVTADSGYDGLSKVTVSVEGGGGGDATIVPLTVTENGVYDDYYEIAEEVWDNNTEYAGSITVSGTALSFKKAELLIVPDDLDELKSSEYTCTIEMVVDGETGVIEGLLNESELSITQGVCATLMDYAVVWVKQAAPLNAQFGTSFLEDNTVYVTNYAQMMLTMQGASYVKLSVTAPSKKVENVAYRPVTVELPISEEQISFTVWVGQTFTSSEKYYRQFLIRGPTARQINITPTPVEQTFVADEGECFTKVTVGAVDISDITKQHILCGIYLKSMPKTEYKVGEWYDPTGGVLLCQYTDGTTSEMPLPIDDEEVKIYGFTTDNPGTITITVKYTEGGITSQTIYEITVTE